MFEFVRTAVNRLKYKLHPRRISKALGAALGGVTGASVAAFAVEWLDTEIPSSLAAVIAVVITSLGSALVSYAAPENQDPFEAKLRKAFIKTVEDLKDSRSFKGLTDSAPPGSKVVYEADDGERDES